MPPSCYSDPAIHAREERAIFRATWQLAGFDSQLTCDGAFITARVGGRSVVVRREGGELRAFTNVCAHRGAQIFSDCSGATPFRCDSHGWTYDHDGRACGAGADSRARLERWQLARLGPLVLVKLRDDGVSLEAALGAVREPVARIADALGEKLLEDAHVVRANWKVPVENALDQYHLMPIHSRTLGRAGFAGNDCEFLAPHSTFRSALGATMAARWNRVIAAAFPDRPFPLDGYVHVAVFPNLLFSTTQGTIFTVQEVTPLGPTECRFVNHVFLTRTSAPPRPAIVEAFRDQVMALSRAVVAEDMAMCEQAQLGLAEAKQHGLLALQERRIATFHRACLEALARSDAP
jgi:phenylpropionate dioxygenase-like ring-hydroxylating dioxygenase large terminal subunit